MNLTKNFTLEELLHSDYGEAHNIENLATDDVVYNLTALAQDILQPLRDLYGKQIKVNSGYRCKQINDAVGSKDTSQHLIGQAADLDCDDNKKLYELIVDNLDYDQLIDEKSMSWVHVSYKPHGVNRNQQLVIK